MTVLNPLGRADEHIMDDADLYGPLIFCFCFATCLLFVGLLSVKLSYGLAANHHSSVWKASFRLYLWRGPVRLCLPLYSPQSHVRDRHRCISSCICLRLLPTSYGWCRRCQCSDTVKVRLLLCYSRVPF